jgi:hypothetical protein
MEVVLQAVCEIEARCANPELLAEHRQAALRFRHDVISLGQAE